ncbi:hypothetical protein CC2G_011117 [Coprinopsis cinerea AmutBmut pab1-1]|nr:hypothetical protein CC2G_011117 [Coprinopsis cinerea AmutBmut pab1-1]
MPKNGSGAQIMKRQSSGDSTMSDGASYSSHPLQPKSEPSPSPTFIHAQALPPTYPQIQFVHVPGHPSAKPIRRPTIDTSDLGPNAASLHPHASISTTSPASTSSSTGIPVPSQGPPQTVLDIQSLDLLLNQTFQSLQQLQALTRQTVLYHDQERRKWRNHCLTFKQERDFARRQMMLLSQERVRLMAKVGESQVNGQPGQGQGAVSSTSGGAAPTEHQRRNSEPIVQSSADAMDTSSSGRPASPSEQRKAARDLRRHSPYFNDILRRSTSPVDFASNDHETPPPSVSSTTTASSLAHGGGRSFSSPPNSAAQVSSPVQRPYTAQPPSRPHSTANLYVTPQSSTSSSEYLTSPISDDGTNTFARIELEEVHSNRSHSPSEEIDMDSTSASEGGPHPQSQEHSIMGMIAGDPRVFPDRYPQPPTPEPTRPIHTHHLDAMFAHTNNGQRLCRLCVFGGPGEEQGPCWRGTPVYSVEVREEVLRRHVLRYHLEEGERVAGMERERFEEVRRGLRADPRLILPREE